MQSTYLTLPTASRHLIPGYCCYHILSLCVRARDCTGWFDAIVLANVEPTNSKLQRQLKEAMVELQLNLRRT